MAEWTTIPDDVLEPGKPIRSVDALALRDNPVAIAAGAANAPRVQTAAIQDAAVTTAKLANSSVTTAKLADASVTTAKLATGERMTTANVLARTAGASAGNVGTYAFLRLTIAISFSPGQTIAGSSLRFAAQSGATTISVTPSLSGTWRAMGGAGSSSGWVTVWLRIS